MSFSEVIDINRLYQPAYFCDWADYILYDLAIWRNGLAFKNINFSDKGRPVIKIAELKNGLTGQTKYTNDTFDKSYYLTKNDMLFSWSGNPETSIDIFWYELPDGWLNQHIFKITVGEKVNKTYFYYMLKFMKPNFTQIATNKQTTGLGHVTIGDLKNMKVKIPNLPEQKAIADTLSALDDKIELNNRMNKTLEEMAQAIFKSWFVDFEPFQDGEFEDSELGRIPKGWRVVTLRELCSVITKGTTPTTLKKQFVEYGINFIKAESITDNHAFDNSKFAHIDDETNILLKRSIIQENDLLLTIAGTIGRYALVTKEILPANTNQAIGIIRIDSAKVNPLYILCLFLCDKHKNYLESKIVQAVQANLSLGVIGDLPVLIPKNDIMVNFIYVIKPIFEKIYTNNRNNQSLSQTRDSLLPKLMSGEIRVPIEEVTADA